MGAKVVIAEDDRSVRNALERALKLEGYSVVAVGDGVAALDAVTNHRPDVVVLDLMMPFLDGVSVCRELRQRANPVPVLMLTARHEVRDRVNGLDAGADDYLTKPFALDELTARVRALLRRSGSDESSVIGIDDLTIDPRARRVLRSGRVIELTKTEFDLLRLLVENAGIVLTREVLYERIWGIDFETSSKTLDVYVGYLRRKTEEDGSCRLLHTVRGIGYVARTSATDGP
ncbi:MAG: response regulator transcription factor [Acidimicrobiia bacterium]